MKTTLIRKLGGFSNATVVSALVLKGGGGPSREYQYCCDWCPVKSKDMAEPTKIYENL
jgi:hypothetical protein